MTDRRKFIARNALHSRWSSVMCLQRKSIKILSCAKHEEKSRPILGASNAGELASSWVLKREKAPQPRQESENKEAIINASRRTKGRTW